MEDKKTIALGFIIVLVFIWRFVRTRQLYLTSLKLRADELGSRAWNPRCIYDQIFLGHRTIKPYSFFIRAFILAVFAVCLLPFKHYAPSIYWIVISLILLYIPWCVVHGVMLKKAIRNKVV